MPISVSVKKPQKKVSIGDMRDKIIIRVRTITPPSDIDFTETFDRDINVWSLCQTKSGVEIFDGTNLKGVATHYFYIRYFKNLTAESWVFFKGNTFDILDIQNLDERNDFLLLRCSIRGDSTKRSTDA